MQSILIIEPDVAELEILMDICRDHSREFIILTARDRESALQVLNDRHVDLIMCSTVFPDTEDCHVLAAVASSFPYIPLISLAPPNSADRERVRALGASSFHRKPVENDRLLERVTELIDYSSTGTVRGIPLHSFLQMLEGEGKTCTLQVFGNDRTGLIFIRDGVPVNAETGDLQAEESVYEIISWNDVIIDIRHFNGLRDNVINKPLISLIMEGFRLKDERESRKKKEQAVVRPRHNLKQAPTAGKRLALDIGLRLKLEFDTIEAGFDSVLVGMIPDTCVIVATPGHFVINRTQVEAARFAVVKYPFMGTLCLFKSRILRVIETPWHMMFLDYPAVIHYREMRTARRSAVYIPCTLSLADGSRYFGAFRDLSSTGGHCQVTQKGNRAVPEIGIRQTIGLRCLLPGLSEEQSIKGIVRNVKHTAKGVYLGIEFAGLHTHMKETIERCLLSTEAQTGQPLRFTDAAES